MLEKDFQTKFNKWLARHWHNGTAAFELKIVKPPAKSLAFDAVRENQYQGLELATKRLIWKIGDTDPRLKPYDSFIMQEAQAYLVVLWYQPRGTSEVTMIDIKTLLEYKLRSTKKSFTQQEARQLATYIYET